ncbi:unnamed protein product [Prorocentrum cordatum]|uniref:Uncharacterized protein n=1 Tax=Prorocentrum cordatum TaxID=2364126 RepID=A0ABN9PL82_9DINO|nr:unnamed protein product [Polarella glacialis]
MALAAAPGQVSVEDMMRLQSQLDQVKERLDFISPMLPLVNFVQDYFQKVECEASMQLRRLRNAQTHKRPERDDEVSNAQLETVKWLHFVTETVMALQGGALLYAGGAAAAGGGRGGREPQASQSLPAGSAQGSVPGSREIRDAEPGQRCDAARAVAAREPRDGGRRRPPHPRGRAGALSRLLDGALHGATAPAGPPVARGARDAAGRLHVRPHRRAGTPAGARRGRPRAGAPGARRRRGRRLRDAPGRGAAGAAAHRRDLLHAGARGQDDAGPGQPRERRAAARRGPRAFAGGQRQRRRRVPADVLGGSRWGAREVPGRRPPRLAAARRAEPARRRRALRGARDGLGRAGARQGLLGLRLPAGVRAQERDALALLCSSGIVTARELSDDLTVISEDIDECVEIAREMLQTWPMDIRHVGQAADGGEEVFRGEADCTVPAQVWREGGAALSVPAGSPRPSRQIGDSVGGHCAFRC